MGVIAISGIRYNKWLGFAWRPILLALPVAAIAIIAAEFKGYN